jgi:hypothetical protein
LFVRQIGGRFTPEEHDQVVDEDQVCVRLLRKNVVPQLDRILNWSFFKKQKDNHGPTWARCADPISIVGACPMANISTRCEAKTLFTKSSELDITFCCF